MSKTALRIILSLIAGILLFHVLILLKIVPYDITWGGRLKNDAEMYVFESVSIVLNMLLFSALLIKAKLVREIIAMKIVNIVLWVFFVLFALNTVGNIFAETNFEKSFSLLTLALSILLWMILKREKQSN